MTSTLIYFFTHEIESINKYGELLPVLQTSLTDVKDQVSDLKVGQTELRLHFDNRVDQIAGAQENLQSEVVRLKQAQLDRPPVVEEIRPPPGGSLDTYTTVPNPLGAIIHSFTSPLRSRSRNTHH
jgi:hypothetical protein